MVPLFKVYMSENTSVDPVLHSGFISQGEKVEEFERKLGDRIGNPLCLTTNSGTAALTLALKLLEKPNTGWPGFYKSKDVVLTPALTCFATTCAVISNDYNLRWIDVDPETANVDIDDIANKLTERTQFVVVVHWGGYPVDLDRLRDLQEIHKEKYGYRFMIVEDCAHAFGAMYKGRSLGNHGNLCAFSFQAIKHLTCGDGGLLVLPTEELYDRGKLLRWFGIDRNKRNYNRKDFRLENDIIEAGGKYHMNDINASIGLQNIQGLDLNIAKCRQNTFFIREGIYNVKGIRLMEDKQDRESACWLFTLRVSDKNRFVEHMKTRDITTSQVHNRNDINSCVEQFKESLPNLDNFEPELVCIPCGWWLSPTDVKHIIHSIREFHG